MQGRGIHTLSNILRTCGPRYRESVSWGGRVAVRTRGQARGRAGRRMQMVRPMGMQRRNVFLLKRAGAASCTAHGQVVFVMYVRWPLVPHSKGHEMTSRDGGGRLLMMMGVAAPARSAKSSRVLPNAEALAAAAARGEESTIFRNEKKSDETKRDKYEHCNGSSTLVTARRLL